MPSIGGSHLLTHLLCPSINLQKLLSDLLTLCIAPWNVVVHLLPSTHIANLVYFCDFKVLSAKVLIFHQAHDPRHVQDLAGFEARQRVINEFLV